jgi:hypothetical protein
VNDPLDNQFLQVFLVYVLPILLTGLALLVGWLLTKRAQWWTASNRSGALWDSLRLAEELAGKAVAAALADLSGKYKLLVADGNLSAADLAELRIAALDILKTKLGASGMDFLRASLARVGVNLDSFLQTQVSAAISRLAGMDPTATVTTLGAVPSPAVTTGRVP